ncbi:MAG: type 1 pili tip component [Gammaproteobacteria bacterium]|jgi:hypothetical protein
MTSVKSLVAKWEQDASTPLTDCEYSILLPTYEAAKIEALAEMFPGKTRQQIITDLLAAALDELEEAFPYVKGDRVIGQDEFGDPRYNDAGFTSTLIELTNKHLDKLCRKPSVKND